ncbi:TrlF family AAA-like ATPase [Propionicimonas sp. T2.31MG-18]|uniref:TrlF family AAA-like ATPase n=1 Tax=Propionicimonas sp. T2.31MG-18 TaxID=3157620 RepID=UPI00366E5BDD
MSTLNATYRKHNSVTHLRHERGAEWSIWDLHVHTPDSIQHGYGSSDTAWQRFIDELESLPKDLRVIAVSDYWFLDGFRKISAERTKGRVANLDAVFPAIEIRLQDFAGTDGSLRRINAHVVFDPGTTADFIEQQFVSALAPSFQLEPGQSAPWNQTITRESVADLGSAVIASVPETELGSYGSPLQEGFNNLVVPFAKIQELLGRSVLKDKALLILGKAEWTSYKWNEQSIASKKNLINSAKALFTAFGDPSSWESQVAALRQANVNHRILDCSDAHHWSDSANKDRLGNCHTWMRAVPTLVGLRHALEEFESRVRVGRAPEEVSNTQIRPGSYLQSVSIRPSNAEVGSTFDYALPLNHGFVAILGNKGQGKSALLDCVALAGNSDRSEDFAFLTESRFLNGNASAGDYVATIQWADGTADARALDAGCVRERPARVEYLPQSYVERICNARPGSSEAARFESELRSVLFTHIPVSDRLGTESFDALLQTKRAATKSTIRELERSLELLIAEALELVQFQQSQRREALDGQLAGLRTQFEHANAALDAAREELRRANAESANSERLAAVASELASLESDREQLQLKSSSAATLLGLLERVHAEAGRARADATSLRNQAEAVNEGLRTAFAAAQLPKEAGGYVQFATDEAYLDALLVEADRRSTTLRQGQASISQADLELREKIEALQDESARLDAAAERARQLVVDTEARVTSLQGAADDLNSIEGIEQLIARLEQAPAQVDELRTRMLDTCREIHTVMQREREDLAVLYKPATQFMEQHPELVATGLQVSTSLEVGARFAQVGESLDGRKAADTLRWLERVPRTLALDDWDSVEPVLRKFLDLMLADATGYMLKGGYSLKQVASDFLSLRWATLRFGLTGEGRPLAELSPGQRGLILVLFYLLLDRRDSPLLLDQPEENLDNETVSAVLVPAIKDAVRRRQLLIVTHNANLAVVGDADQIVYCRYAEDHFSVTAGSLDDVESARHAVDVLEGTKRALANRWLKFEALPAV